MTTKNAIVFGPTGKVASVAARRAREHGAKVFLAMRDPSKPIPALSPAQEQEGGFERVQADLSKPETVEAAVKRTGAKHAFIYLIYGTPDGMKSCIEALKSGGITFIVFLSSDVIRDDIRSVPSSDIIASAHAQVEITLDEIMGANGYAAVRPAYFASNSLRWKKSIPNGEAEIVFPDADFDWITPGDIGRVCGTLLAGGSQAIDGKQKVIRLNGPELISQRDAVAIMGRAIGKTVKVTELDEQEALASFVSNGMREMVAKNLITALGQRAKAGDDSYESHLHAEAVRNVEKYAGGQATKFPEWAEENKHEFSG